MRTLLKEVDGIDWGDGAVMNCSWRGPLLRDVLRRADVTVKNEGKWHVAFASYHTKVQDDDWYGGSIELKRGLSEDGEVILALEVSSTKKYFDLERPQKKENKRRFPKATRLQDH